MCLWMYSWGLSIILWKGVKHTFTWTSPSLCIVTWILIDSTSGLIPSSIKWTWHTLRGLCWEIMGTHLKHLAHFWSQGRNPKDIYFLPLGGRGNISYFTFAIDFISFLQGPLIPIKVSPIPFFLLHFLPHNWIWLAPNNRSSLSSLLPTLSPTILDLWTGGEREGCWYSLGFPRSLSDHGSTAIAQL